MTRTIVFLICVSLVIVGCAAPTSAPPPTLDDRFALEGTHWSLVSLTLDGVTQALNAVQIPTLEFTADGKIGGTGGCNNFGGSYTAQGEILTIREIRRTLMACMPNEILTLEDAYLSALESARLFEKRGNQLSITFAEGRGRLLFQLR